MTLLAQARDSLQTAQAPFHLEIDEAGQKLTCDFAVLDSLACALSGFELSTSALANKTPSELKQLGEKLSARLTYLLEPINPIEFDAEQCVVQLRSSPPERDEDRTSYYELVVKRGGSLSLCRFVKRPGSARETVPMHLTREVFFRLASDFSSAIA